MTSVRRTALPLAVAVLVVAVVLGVLRLLDPPGSGVGGSGGDPPVLRLSGWVEAVGTGRDAATHSGLVLDGELPPDGPATGRVFAVRADPDADPEALAGALGLRGPGEAGEGGRTWGAGPAQLRVESGSGGWHFGGVVSSADTPAQDASAARAAARAVLEAAGQDPDQATEAAQGAFVTLAVDPVVDGLPTSGMTTSVSAAGPTVLAAQGWLAVTEPGATYPLISAREAWDVLVATPRPVPLMACPEPAPSAGLPVQYPGCGGGPVRVTGARAGLSLQWSGAEPVLVPSWLFTVDGSPAPLAQVAVEPRLLGPDDAGAGGGSGGGAGGSVGTAEPGVAPGGGDPGQPPPTAAEPPDAGRQSRFTAVERAADDRSLTVRFWGGVEDCYAYTVRAVESDESVELTLSERAKGDGPCIELAQEHTRTVELSAPLGPRVVRDAETGESLLGPSR